MALRSRCWALPCLLAVTLASKAQEAQVPMVPRTYANAQLEWEQLDNGTWKTIEVWKHARLKEGQTHTWDLEREQEGRVQRLLLRVTWRGQSDRLEVAGGFAYLDPKQAPVRVRVDRGLSDGQAWTFGVPTQAGMQGNRVVAKVVLETVMEPWVGEQANAR